MSKEAAMRAMREARYSERATASAAGTPRVRRAVRPVTKQEPVAGPAAAASSAEAVCGHRSMNGRTCTRELGHAAKNHRYS